MECYSRETLGTNEITAILSLNVRFVLSIYFQDYPSVSQVASKLREKNANMIFAVMENVVKEYGKLGAFLDGAVVGKLEKDSANIVELISEKYHVSSTIFFLYIHILQRVSLSPQIQFFIVEILTFCCCLLGAGDGENRNFNKSARELLISI